MLVFKLCAHVRYVRSVLSRRKMIAPCEPGWMRHPPPPSSSTCSAYQRWYNSTEVARNARFYMGQIVLVLFVLSAVTATVRCAPPCF